MLPRESLMVLSQDPAKFPKMASHLAYSWDASALSKFSLNVVRGCTANGAVKDSYAANRQQVNFIVPGRVTSSAPCGNELGFASTYGNGYWAHTTALTSPYLGIGTIRAATFADRAKAPDGSIFLMPGWGHENIEMVLSETAEWAARLKAHHALENVAGAFPEHIHGVWGDNDLYWESAWSNRLRGSGPAWDDGLVLNHLKLREILGDDVLLGGNGSHYTCTGMHGDFYVGTIPNGDCTSMDAAMYEDGSNKFDWIEAWDDNIPQMASWHTKGLPGRARYGIFTVYGSEVAARLGRPLTDADRRLALAHATVAGWHLWITQGSGWDTTIVPGGPNAIPEMGQSLTYPYGWLGDPLEGPIRVGSGMWRRRFTGGVAMANVTDSPATIDGRTIPAKDAIFEKGVTVPQPSVGELITASLSEHRLNKFYYQRWQRDNPVESQKVIAYLDGGSRPTDSEVPTHYGKGLLLAEDARQAS